MVLLGPSWLLLGRLGPKMAPKMGPQMAPHRAKMGNLGDQSAQSQEAGAILKALVSKMAQDGPELPKIASWEPS